MSRSNPHTPGPWRRTGRGNIIEAQVNGIWAPVASYGAHVQALLGDGGEAEADANGRLIEAAPEMYALLERMRDGLTGDCYAAVGEVPELLARIDGEQPLIRPDVLAGDGYRRLLPTETIRKGDQYEHNGEWFDTGDPGYKATEFPYRRRLAPNEIDVRQKQKGGGK